MIYDSVLSDHYYMARFIFDDNVHPDTLENVGFRLRGNSSGYSKKKSFKISFNEYLSGRKYQGVKKINLNGEHNDPTMIREKLCYDIWKKAGMVRPTFAGDITGVMNVDHFLKALAIDVATGNWDDYGYNKNNYYLYQNPVDSTFDFITYDPDTIFPRIDAMKQQIQQAAMEDTWRTLDYGYTVADFNNSYSQATDAHTPYGLKPFFGTRKQSILIQLHPSGISGKDAASNGVEVFPNPAGETISIILSDPLAHAENVEIFDMYGKEQLDFQLAGDKETLIVQSLARGMYLLRVRASGLFYQGKFIKK